MNCGKASISSWTSDLWPFMPWTVSPWKSSTRKSAFFAAISFKRRGTAFDPAVNVELASFDSMPSPIIGPMSPPMPTFTPATVLTASS